MFRDDHEAALARIAALEVQLEREREDDAKQTQRVAHLEHQLDDARAKLKLLGAELAEHRPTPPVRRAAPKKPVDEPRQSVAQEPPAHERRPIAQGPAIVVAALLLIVLAVGLVMMATGVGNPLPSEPTKLQQDR